MGRRRLIRRAGTALLVAATASALIASSAHAVAITEQTSGLQSGQWPAYATSGSDGNLWFTFWGCPTISTCGIARITPSGAVTEYTAGLQPGAFPTYITNGPDGNLWFSDAPETGPPPAIGRITPSGAITEYFAGLVGFPTGITAGPDGNVWFAEDGSRNLGRITPNGVITQFPTGLPAGDDLQEITKGADGNLWFVIRGNDHAIGRMTPTGSFTEFTSGLLPGADLYAITTGPDGNVWFSDIANHAIGRITPGGSIAEFTAGLGTGHSPHELTAGSDGNVWFLDFGSAGPAIGRITPAGAVTEFTSGFQAHSAPRDISSGPDGNLWFTDQACNGGSSPCAIGHVLLQLPPAVTTGPTVATGTRTATVGGTVNPRGGAVSSIVVKYFGPGFRGGRTVAATPSTLAAGGSPIRVTASLSHLPAGSDITYEVQATNAYGSTTGPLMTLHTQPGPRLTHLHQSHRRWRSGAGTTFSFKLSERATVKLRFASVLPGRKRGRRCVASSHHGRRCTRLKNRGTVTIHGHAGRNRIRFDGRISRHKKLGAGVYEVIATARARGAKSRPRHLKFTIVG